MVVEGLTRKTRRSSNALSRVFHFSASLSLTCKMILPQPLEASHVPKGGRSLKQRRLRYAIQRRSTQGLVVAPLRMRTLPSFSLQSLQCESQQIMRHVPQTCGLGDDAERRSCIGLPVPACQIGCLSLKRAPVKVAAQRSAIGPSLER